MPKVGKKKFPYTRKGKARAAAAEQRMARKGAEGDKGSDPSSRRAASRLKSFSDWRGGTKADKKKKARKGKRRPRKKGGEAIHARIDAAERLVAKGKMEPLTRHGRGAGPSWTTFLPPYPKDPRFAHRFGRETHEKLMRESPEYRKLVTENSRRADERRRAWHKKHTKGDKTLEHVPVE